MELGYGLTGPDNVDVFYGKSNDSVVMAMVALIKELPPNFSIALRHDAADG